MKGDNAKSVGKEIAFAEETSCCGHVREVIEVHCCCREMVFGFDEGFGEGVRKGMELGLGQRDESSTGKRLFPEVGLTE